MTYSIAHDKDLSDEMNPVYYVYQETGEIIYTGSYIQCLVIVGALTTYPESTLDEINSRSNGFLWS